MPLRPEDLSAVEREIYDSLPPGQQHIYLDLSDEVRPLIGRWAPAGACPDRQRQHGVCTPDPRVTSQVGVREPTDWDLLPPDSKYSDRIYQYRIKDALRGDLLLTPGGPMGVIGALLSALAPPQDYSHMGIVVADDGFNGTVLRHCTASEDWMMRRQFSTGTIFAGTPLEMSIPQRGFRSDAERFVWPGTLTQTVEVAYKSHYHELYRKEVYEHAGDGGYVWNEGDNGEPERVPRDKYAVLDPKVEGDDRTTGGRYRIAALTFDPVKIPIPGDPEHLAYPLIVQPCPQKRTPAVRAALERIADQCIRLRGHYRFYAYTNGQIGDANDGPLTLERDNEPTCVNGKPAVATLTNTRGMVCSTFIWQAAQLANAEGGPRIVFDGRPHHPEPIAAVGDDQCSQRTALLGRPRVKDSLLDPADPVDGLYFYDSAIREEAGRALQAKLRDKVLSNIKGILDDVTGPPVLGAIEGAWAGSTVSALLSVNPVFLASALAVSKAYLDEQVDRVRETAVHVSNQSGDTFCRDNAALDNESDEWQRNPGSGNTVSPDDILHSWSSPHVEDADTVIGLYGSNIKAVVLPPAPVEGPWKSSTWEIAADRTTMGVRVFRREADGTPTYLPAATVRVGCSAYTTTEVADMTKPQRVECPTGQYFASAAWTDVTNGFQWISPRSIVTIPGGNIDIEVHPPKETNRVITVRGTASLLNRHATDGIPVIGGDPWELEVGFGSDPIPMSLAFDSVDPHDDPEFHQWLAEQHGDSLRSLREQTWSHDFAIEDWGIVRVRCTLTIHADASVTIALKGGTREGQDPQDTTEPDWGAVIRKTVPPKHAGDPPIEFDVTVERTGFAVPPVRANIHFVIDNEQQPG